MVGLSCNITLSVLFSGLLTILVHTNLLKSNCINKSSENWNVIDNDLKNETIFEGHTVRMLCFLLCVCGGSVLYMVVLMFTDGDVDDGFMALAFKFHFRCCCAIRGELILFGCLSAASHWLVFSEVSKCSLGFVLQWLIYLMM